MAKKKKHKTNHATHVHSKTPCADIPTSYIDLPLTAEAFSLGLYLYYSRQYVSDLLPNEEAIRSVLKMPLNIVRHSLKELEETGVLLRQADGTFIMNDNPGEGDQP